MTQLRSARHSRYPSYFAPSGCPMPPRGRRKNRTIISTAGQLSAHSVAQPWADPGPQRGSLLGSLRPTERLTRYLRVYGPQKGSLLGLSWPTARLTPCHRSRGRTIQPRTRPPADARWSGYRQERHRCRQPAYHSDVTHDVTDNIKLISSIVCSVCTRCAVKMHAISSKKHS